VLARQLKDVIEVVKVIGFIRHHGGMMAVSMACINAIARG